MFLCFRILNNMQYIIIPIIVSLIVHLLKLVIDLFKKRFSWQRATGYGGMPSSHSALVTALATAVYLADGISITFAISTILAILVIRDAIGLRGYLSSHGRILNKLIKDLPDEEEYKYPILEEKISHTWLQVIVGGILGILMTWLAFLLI